VGAAVWRVFTWGLSPARWWRRGQAVATPLFHWVATGAELEALERGIFVSLATARRSPGWARRLGIVLRTRETGTGCWCICADLFNSLLSYAAMFGHVGLPEVGALGPAIATRSSRA